MSDVQILGKPVLSGSRIRPLNEIEVFSCKLDETQINETILYQLFRTNNLTKALGEYSAHSKEEASFPSKISLAYDGSLICKASVQNNSEISPTFSNEKVFQVVGELKRNEDEI